MPVIKPSSLRGGGPRIDVLSGELMPGKVSTVNWEEHPYYLELTEILERMAVYRTRAVGIDMMIKLFVYSARLISAQLFDSGRQPHRDEMCQLFVTRATETRMIANLWKWLATGPGAYSSFKKGPTDVDGECPWYVWIFLLGSMTLRTGEQFSGDLGCYQRFWFSNWNGPVISWYYKFFKSLALTCGAAADLVRFFRFRNQALRARTAATAGANAPPSPSSTGGTSSPLTTTDEHPIPMTPSSTLTPAGHSHKDGESDADAGGSSEDTDVDKPNIKTVTPRRDPNAASTISPQDVPLHFAKKQPSALNFDGHQPHMNTSMLPSAARHASPARKDVPIGGSKAGSKPNFTDLSEKEACGLMSESLMLFFRNIGDMIIYYAWIDWYKPNKTLAALCGIYSALVGIMLVWRTSPVPKNAILRRNPPPKETIANDSSSSGSAPSGSSSNNPSSEAAPEAPTTSSTAPPAAAMPSNGNGGDAEQPVAEEPQQAEPTANGEAQAPAAPADDGKTPENGGECSGNEPAPAAAPTTGSA